MRSKFILLLAVLMGLITTLLFYQYTKKIDVEKTSALKTVQVVIAKEKIAKNETITAKKLELVKMPESAVLPQSYKTIDQIDGKIATTVIEKGEQIPPIRVVSSQKEKVFVSRKIHEGYQAVSVGVNINQSVSNLIEPEDIVDVVFTKNDQSAQTPVESTILLKKVRVLAVGKVMAASEKSKQKDEEYSSVTLELKSEDAVKLVSASEQGKIHFILYKRPATDAGNK